MKKIIFAAAMSLAALGLAACGQPTAPEPEAPAAPQSLSDQAAQLSPEQQPVFAWQQLTAYQAAHPESQPACVASGLREVASRGTIPPDVAPDSVYAAYAGSWVFSVQCGPQLTGIPSKPEDHWLVVLAPGAAEPTIVNCADERGRDRCPAIVPRAVPATTP